MQYEMNGSGKVRTCFPKSLDTSEFVEITDIESIWAKFLDPETGKVHDCEQYFNEMFNQSTDQQTKRIINKSEL